MPNNKPKTPLQQSSIPKPYCSIGAGRLTSFVWKTGDQDAGWRYRFNLFRLAAGGGRVSQLFQPADLMNFVKLVQVMASVIADDGCLEQVDRGVLKRLATDLDELLNRAAQRATASDVSDGCPENHIVSPQKKESCHGDSPHS